MSPVGQVPWCIYLDEHLLGDAHLSQLRPKLAGAIAGMARARRTLGTKECLPLYHAFFSSRMAYGVEFFGLNYKNRLNPILVLQKRALRCLLRLSPLEPSAPIFKSLNILPFPLYIEYNLCIHIFKTLQGIFPNVCDIVTSQNSTRGGGSNPLLVGPCT